MGKGLELNPFQGYLLWNWPLGAAGTIAGRIFARKSLLMGAADQGEEDLCNNHQRVSPLPGCARNSPPRPRKNPAAGSSPHPWKGLAVPARFVVIVTDFRILLTRKRPRASPTDAQMVIPCWQYVCRGVLGLTPKAVRAYVECGRKRSTKGMPGPSPVGCYTAVLLHAFPSPVQDRIPQRETVCGLR